MNPPTIRLPIDQTAVYRDRELMLHAMLRDTVPLRWPFIRKGARRAFLQNSQEQKGRGEGQETGRAPGRRQLGQGYTTVSYGYGRNFVPTRNSTN